MTASSPSSESPLEVETAPAEPVEHYDMTVDHGSDGWEEFKEGVALGFWDRNGRVLQHEPQAAV